MYSVEVFPIEPRRWIAVMEASGVPFSTEAASPEEVEDAARAAITEVLRIHDPQLELLDELGRPWNSEIAASQLKARDDR
jgi:hypothetical protein